jgi:hypothetical protein
MVGWALSIGLIDLPFTHWTHVTFKQSRICEAESDGSLPPSESVFNSDMRSIARHGADGWICDGCCSEKGRAREWNWGGEGDVGRQADIWKVVSL